MIETFPLLLGLLGAQFGVDPSVVQLPDDGAVAPVEFWGGTQLTVAAYQTSPYEALIGASTSPVTAWESLVAPPVGFSVQQTALTPYESLQGDAVTVDTPYEALIGVQNAPITPYEATGLATQSLTSPWESAQVIATAVQQVFATQWEALGYVETDFNTTWEALQDVSPDATLQSAWESVGIVVAQDSPAWEGSGLTVSQFIEIWESLDAEGRARTPFVLGTTIDVEAVLQTTLLVQPT